MSYDPTQPAAGTSPASTRATIQGNFNQANIAIGRDHIPFSAATNEGLHQKVTLVTVQPSAGPSISGTQSALYMKTVGATQQLFYKNSAGEQRISDLFSPSSLTPNGYIRFGTLLVQWVAVAPFPTSGGSHQVNFPVEFSSVPWNVQLTLRRDSSATEASAVVRDNGLTKAHAIVILPSGANNNGWYLLAIGPA